MVLAAGEILKFDLCYAAFAHKGVVYEQSKSEETILIESLMAFCEPASKPIR